MGLDQLAYSRPATATNDKADEQLVSWRKHPNLQGWMERLWRKQKYGDAAIPGVNARAATADSLMYSKDTYMDNPFNQEEVELTLDDIKRLRLDIRNKTLNGGYGDTTGFFFGDSSDEYYRETDIEFCDKAEAALNKGCKVIYYSWW